MFVMIVVLKVIKKEQNFVIIAEIMWNLLKLILMKKKNFLIIMVTILVLTSCKLGRFVVYNFADINDHKKFPKRDIEKSVEPFYFNYKLKEQLLKKVTLTIKGEKKEFTFEEYLEMNKTVAFIVIKKDTVIYEKYFDGYDKEKIVPSFSMAKSVISMLIGCAIDDGFIKSVDEPITNYLPELKKNGFEKVTISHLLNMTSGIKFNESYYNPFGNAASVYYGRNLKKEISKLKLEKDNKNSFSYSSGDSQILGLILESSLKGKKISEYLEEKIWNPLGMEYNASWSLDKKEGVEKTFCCLNSVAIDYAKLGRLFLNNGNWNGKQIISKEWVEKTTKAENNLSGVWYYQNQWWISNKEDRSYRAEGILGQYIYVNPKTETIIVRLGREYGKYSDWNTVFESIAKAKVK
jgi:CubicO group peptidase (beta-lactamase class C family)